MNNAEIIELASLWLAEDQSNNAGRLEVAARGDPIGFDLSLMAADLLSGQFHTIRSANPESIGRARSLATELGASIVEFKESENLTSIKFAPLTGH
jgi:hypothetical protein